MAPNKRRRLNIATELNNISAFAVRSRLQFAQENPPVSDEETIPDTYEGQAVLQGVQLLGAGSLNRQTHAASVLRAKAGEDLMNRSHDLMMEVGELSNELEGDDGRLLGNIKGKSRASGAPCSAQPEAPLTTIDLTKGNGRHLDDGSFILEISLGERLVVLGEYGLSVQSGEITLLGAAISASEIVYDVYAPLSHSLPVIRYSISENNKAEIRLHQRNHGLRSLGRISPLFAGLWNGKSSHLRPEESVWLQQQGRGEPVTSSFHIISSKEASPRKAAYPIISPPEWNEFLYGSPSIKSPPETAPIIMICGPKASGKSTFAKLLTNRIVTSGLPTTKPVASGPAKRFSTCVAFLDLDPGQPEYSSPGQLSLIILSAPQFGPSYSHPDSSNNGRELIRAHSTGATSPSADPNLYMSCVVDLLSCYVNMLSHKPCSLVINTPGWIFGTGLDLLLKLIREAKPSQILYMSQEGPREVVESLREEAKSSELLTLPSQPTEKATRTAAQLRQMQYMSYFHFSPWNKAGDCWSSIPLTSMAPWEVKYAGETSGILGVMCLGDPPLPTMIRDAIDGTILVVVVLDDFAAFPAYRGSRQIWEYSSDNTVNGKSKDTDYYQKPSIEREVDVQNDYQLERPWFIQTPERIPYINPAQATYLDPKYSHSIGLALLRGIDTNREIFHLLTPISEKTIKNAHASGKPIVLLSGKLDTPGWAYLEEFYDKAGLDPGASEVVNWESSNDGGEESGSEEETDGRAVFQGLGSFEHAPWIERSHGGQNRGAGARVWRVRRDLGKSIENT